MRFFLVIAKWQKIWKKNLKLLDHPCNLFSKQKKNKKQTNKQKTSYEEDWYGMPITRAMGEMLMDFFIDYT